MQAVRRAELAEVFKPKGGLSHQGREQGGERRGGTKGSRLIDELPLPFLKTSQLPASLSRCCFLRHLAHCLFIQQRS